MRSGPRARRHASCPPARACVKWARGGKERVSVCGGASAARAAAQHARRPVLCCGLPGAWMQPLRPQCAGGANTHARAPARCFAAQGRRRVLSACAAPGVPSPCAAAVREGGEQQVLLVVWWHAVQATAAATPPATAAVAVAAVVAAPSALLALQRTYQSRSLPLQPERWRARPACGQNARGSTSSCPPSLLAQHSTAPSPLGSCHHVTARHDASSSGCPGGGGALREAMSEQHFSTAVLQLVAVAGWRACGDIQ